MKIRHQFLKLKVRASSIPPRRVTNADVRSGIRQREFFLEYQPIVHLTSGAIVGAEALVRWRHPNHGLLSAEQFIPLMEESMAIIPLGRFVLREACAVQSRLHHRYPRRADFAMHVNVSGRQLRGSGFANDVQSELATMRRTEPDSLVLELTETEPPDSEMLKELALLKRQGVRLALDDFGTAFASMSYLRDAAFDVIKIDRSFVSGLGQRASDHKLTRAVLDLGRMLHLEVVAEGIERHQQLTQLHAMGCDLGQGYYFSRPVSPEAIEELVAQTARSDRRAVAS